MALSGARASVAPAGMSTKIIAIDGPGGSGKSTFAELLSSGLGGIQIVHADDFATWDNPIHWWPDLLDRVLKPLAAGVPAGYVPTSWDGEARSRVVVRPAEYVILARIRPLVTVR